jgi:hypothetical protein
MGKTAADDLLERLQTHDVVATPETLDVVVQMRSELGRVVDKRARRRMMRVLERHDALTAQIRASVKRPL